MRRNAPSQAETKVARLTFLLCIDFLHCKMYSMQNCRRALKSLNRGQGRRLLIEGRRP